jgi:hypothetical protein
MSLNSIAAQRLEMQQIRLNITAKGYKILSSLVSSFVIAFSKNNNDIAQS